MKKVTLYLIASFVSWGVAAQGWQIIGSEVHNTNLGAVVIKANPGHTGTLRLAAIPAPTDPGAAIIIGEGNTGSGEYTSLTMATTAYQNGYALLQSIKSAGSAYGFLALNPNGGSVGIGTTNPGNYKLAVEGLIGAREVKVHLNSWADHVFSPDHNRMTLAGLEAFINKNKHLPNIPSAQEVKDNGGIELGDINVKLLEKIEELTLYLIELNKKVEKLEKENEDLKNKQ